MNPQAKLTITSDTTITGLTAPSYQKGTKPVKVQFLLNGLPVLTKSASECFKVQTRSNTKLPEHRWSGKLTGHSNPFPPSLQSPDPVIHLQNMKFSSPTLREKRHTQR